MNDPSASQIDELLDEVNVPAAMQTDIFRISDVNCMDSSL